MFHVSIFHNLVTEHWPAPGQKPYVHRRETTPDDRRLWSSQVSEFFSPAFPFLTLEGPNPWPQYICTSSEISEKGHNPVTIAPFFFSLPIMLSFRFTQKPTISLFLLIHSVCSIPTPFQLPHNNEIIPALSARGDDPSLISFSSSDWTSKDRTWSNSLLQNSNIPATKGILFGANGPAPSTEFVDFAPGSPDIFTPEQEQQPQQLPGKLQKGDNGCPAIFPKAVCDPGEGVTVITKAALPGFLNLDKCRQSMHLSLGQKEKRQDENGKSSNYDRIDFIGLCVNYWYTDSPLVDPCREPERFWCCAFADTQDLVGIYGVRTVPFFPHLFLLILYILPSPPLNPFTSLLWFLLILSIYQQIYISCEEWNSACQIRLYSLKI